MGVHREWWCGERERLEWCCNRVRDVSRWGYGLSGVWVKDG